MREPGSVLQTKDRGMAVVQFRVGGACSKCGACLIKGDNAAQIEAINNVGAGVGDAVLVETKPKDVAMAAFTLFIVPIILMVIGYFLGSRVSEVVGILTALIFLSLSFLGVNSYDRAARKKGKFTSEIVRIIKPAAKENE